MRRLCALPANRGLAAAVIVALAGVAGCSRAATTCDTPPSGLREHRVVHVVDGDTVHLKNGDKVRLIGINTPEIGRDGHSSQPLAEEATARLRQLVGPDGSVLLQDGRESRDRHGRRLAHLFDTSGGSIEAALLRSGMAFHVAVAPNFAHLDCLQAAEREAVAAGRGVWGEARYAPLAVAELGVKQRGFILVRGRVTRVSFKSNGWWVQLDGKLGLRIDESVQKLFRRTDLAALEGHMITARGWLVPMGDWWQMKISHPAMLHNSP